MIRQSEIGTSSWIILITVDHIYYTLLRQVLGFSVPFLPTSANYAKMVGQKHFVDSLTRCLYVHPRLHKIAK
jgi:hypothetical protein